MAVADRAPYVNDPNFYGNVLVDYPEDTVRAAINLSDKKGVLVSDILVPLQAIEGCDTTGPAPEMATATRFADIAQGVGYSATGRVANAA